MDKKISNSWWDNYRRTVKITKRFRELVKLVGNSEDTAKDLLGQIRQKYPDKEEIWYLDKLIAELKEKNMVGLAY